MDHSTLPSVRFEWDHLTLSSGIIQTQEQAAEVIAIIEIMASRLLPRKTEPIPLEKKQAT